MRHTKEYVIVARWDAEAEVWVAQSDDVPGLVAECASLDELMRELKVLVPELLELNGAIERGTHSVPFDLIARERDGIPA